LAVGEGTLLTKDILFGMNILTLAGFIVVGITLPLTRTGPARKAMSIALMAAGTALGCMPDVGLR
jgi:hypothetical protein